MRGSRGVRGLNGACGVARGLVLAACVLACAAAGLFTSACAGAPAEKGGASTSGASATDAYADELVSAGQLHVACAFDSVPYAGESGSAKAGYAYELVQAIADELGLELVWEDVDDDEAALARASATGERVVGGSYARSDVALATTGAAATLQVDGASVALGTTGAADGADAASSADTGGSADASGAAGSSDSSSTSDAASSARSALAQCGSCLQSSLSLVARKAAELDASALAGESGAKIGVVAGSPAEAFAMRSFPNCELVAYTTPSELFSAVQARNVEAAVADTAQANYHIRVAYGDEHIAATYENAVSSYALACDAGKSKLAARVEQALAALDEQGRTAELYAAWFEQGEKERGTTDARTPEQGAPTHDKGGGA